MKKKPEEAMGHVAALLTIFIWGTTFISTKILLLSFNPLEILFYRFIIGFAVLLLIYPKRMKIGSLKQELLFVCAGLSGVSLYFLFENIALMHSTASNVGTIISAAPFFTAIFAYWFAKWDKPSKRFLLGFVVAMAGVAMLSFNGKMALQLNPIGDLLALLAALVWGVYAVLTKKMATLPYHTIQMTRRVFFYGLLFLLPGLFFFGVDFQVALLTQPANLFNILYLGLGASALCYVTWGVAVKKLGPVRTSVYIYIAPVVTVVTSILVLHEPITPLAVCGIVVTLTGLVISEGRPVQKKQESFGENA